MHDFNQALGLALFHKSEFTDKGLEPPMSITETIFALRAMIKLQGEASDDAAWEVAEYSEYGITTQAVKDTFKAMLSETLKEVEQENGK